jgi:hypothetical protein
MIVWNKRMKREHKNDAAKLGELHSQGDGEGRKEMIRK